MKKLLTLALAVLGFTAAQAVTINWTATNNLCQNTQMNVILWNGDIDSAMDFVALARPNGDGVIGDFKYRSDGSSWTDDTSKGVTKELIGSNNGSTTWGGVYSNTDVSGSLEVFASAAYSSDQMTAWDGVGTVIFIDGDSTNAAYYELTASQIALLKAGTNVDISMGNVPEPTVLALLALGVAGVALKRKKVVA